MINIHVLHCGNVRVDEALPFRDRSKNPLAYTGILRTKKHKVTLPVFAYLIKHPKGNVLIDTGWDIGVRSNARKALGFFVHFASKPILPPGKAISEQLVTFGITAKELDYLVLTHLDADHAGGLPQLLEAKNILASENELKAAKHEFRYNMKPVSHVHFQPFAFSPSKHGMTYDLFGDETILLVYLPGHSNGMTGVLVRNNGKFAIIAGDCGYATESWTNLRLPGIVSNKSKMTASLKWLKEMSQQSDCIAVLASHDPEIGPQTIIL